MLHVHPCHKEQLHCPKNPVLSHPPLQSPPTAVLPSREHRPPPRNPQSGASSGTRMSGSPRLWRSRICSTQVTIHRPHGPWSGRPSPTPGHPSHVSAQAAVGNAPVNICVQGSLGHTWSDPGVNAEACDHWTVHRAPGWFWKKPQAPSDTAAPFRISSSHLLGAPWLRGPPASGADRVLAHGHSARGRGWQMVVSPCCFPLRVHKDAPRGKSSRAGVHRADVLGRSVCSGECPPCNWAFSLLSTKSSL